MSVITIAFPLITCITWNCWRE